MEDCENGAGRILKKVRTRMLRIAWNRYRQGCNELEQEGKHEKKLSEAEIRLKFRAKKRLYLAVKEYALRCRTAKSFLRNLIKRIDKHNKNVSFRTWLEFVAHEQLLKKQEEQARLVDEMHANQLAIGEAGDEVTAAKDRMSAAERVLKNLARQRLRLYFARATGGAVAWAFETWRAEHQNATHREQLFRNVAAHLHRNALKALFARWKQESGKGAVQEYEEMVMGEDSAMQQQTGELHRESVTHRKRADQCANQKRLVDADAARVTHQTQKFMGSMIAANQGMVFQGKLRYYFGSWREGHRRRKQSC